MIPRRVVRDLERQLSREPGNQSVRLTLAAAYRELGRHDDAVEQYRLVARGFLEEGRADEALAACASGLALAPADAQLGELSARVRAIAGDGDGGVGQGGRAARPVRAASPAGSQHDLETPLPPPMPLHDSADSLIGLPVGLTTAEVTAERAPRPLPPPPGSPAPLPAPPAVRPSHAHALVGSPGDLPRLPRPGATTPLRPRPRPAAASLDPARGRALEAALDEALREAGDDDDGVVELDTGSIIVDTGSVQLDTGSVTLDGRHGGDDDGDELDVAEPVVALTDVRKPGDPPVDVAAELVTRKRPRLSAHELGVLELDIFSATDDVPTLDAPAASPVPPGPATPVDGGRAARDTEASPPAALDTALDTPALPAEDGAVEEREVPVGAAAADEPAVIVAAPLGPPPILPLPEPGLDALADSGSAAGSDFDDEPTEPPAPDAEPPERLHAALTRVMTEEPRGSGTFAGGFTGTLAELAPDGSALDGPLGVFSMLPPEAANELARRAVVKLYDPGEVVVREGDAGDSCFVIARGEVAVTRAGADGEPPVELARLGEGALFGEFAILADRRRHATVTALGEAEVYLIPRLLLRELAAIYPEVGPALERFYRERLLANLLQTSPLFARLELHERAGLLTAFEPMRVESGHPIVRQGERAGGLFLIVLGAVEVVCRTDDRRAVVLATLGEGAYVGEISLLTDDVATASVVACGPVELAALPAPAFYRVVSEYPELWAAMRDEAEARRLRTAHILAGRTAVV